jgi:hypothetical protein
MFILVGQPKGTIHEMHVYFILSCGLFKPLNWVSRQGRNHLNWQLAGIRCYTLDVLLQQHDFAMIGVFFLAAIAI